MALDDVRARCWEGLGAAASRSSDDHSGWGFASVMNDGGAYDGKPETIMNSTQVVSPT